MNSLEPLNISLVNDVKDIDNKIDNNSCPICMENLNETTSYTLECGHKFHNKCIITWFRMGNKNCPICRNVGNTEGQINFLTYKARFKINKELSKHKLAPKHLKKLVKQYEKKKIKLNNKKKLFSEWKKSEEYKLYRELDKKYKKFRNSTSEWYLYRMSNYKCIERQIAEYPITPMIIVKKKYKYEPV